MKYNFDYADEEVPVNVVVELITARFEAAVTVDPHGPGAGWPSVWVELNQKDGESNNRYARRIVAFETWLSEAQGDDASTFVV